MRQCRQGECRFRFPAPAGGAEGERCPRCGGPTDPVGLPYSGQRAERRGIPAGGPAVEALLDNIRSIYNVGSMFRTADGAGIRHLRLAGITPTPAHPRVAKTALGAEQSVPWSYTPNGLEAAVALKERGYRLWALEGGPRAEPLFTATGLDGPPIVLVVGNELAGVDPAVLAECERVFYLPMQGEKGSLNVVVAFGIAAYFVRYRLAGF